MIGPADVDRMHESLDAALQSWRQGDFAIGPFGFVKRFDPSFPLKEVERGAYSGPNLPPIPAESCHLFRA
jgi:hypothetical protein